MCHIFAGQAAERYAYETRSVRLRGHVTSIRLEKAYWDILEDIAEQQRVPLARFLTTLYEEVLELRGEARNFTSLLRCACLTYVEQVRDDATREAELKSEAERAMI
ncbi:MAG: ribbon-helix-helix domain-containing protein [Hyphomicrobiaceae bacterium]